MYLCDNKIPNGCPKPEDVKWLRPEEIINEIIKYGDDKYKDSS